MLQLGTGLRVHLWCGSLWCPLLLLLHMRLRPRCVSLTPLLSRGGGGWHPGAWLGRGTLVDFTRSCRCRILLLALGQACSRSSRGSSCLLRQFLSSLLCLRCLTLAGLLSCRSLSRTLSGCFLLLFAFVFRLACLFLHKGVSRV